MSDTTKTTTEPTASDIEQLAKKRDLSGSNTLSDEELKKIAIGNAFKTNPNSINTKTLKYPTEVVDLPSRGLVYDETSPLRSGTIEMKYMTAKEEDILSSTNYIRQGVVMDMLFRSLIVTPIDYDDLYIGDRNAIMIAARLLSYGKEYRISVIDPTISGDVKQEIVVDLTTITTKEIDYSIFEGSSGEYFYTLPTSKTVIGCRLSTVGMEKNIKDALEKQKRKDAKKLDVTSHQFTTRLKYIITSVDGDYDQNTINEFVDEYFLASDSKAFRDWYKSIQPNVDFTIQFTSDVTGETVEMELPIETEFFWPK